MSHQKSMTHASEKLLNVLFHDGSRAKRNRFTERHLRLLLSQSSDTKSEAQLFVLSYPGHGLSIDWTGIIGAAKPLFWAPIRIGRTYA
jgi:hypothetical protein